MAMQGYMEPNAHILRLTVLWQELNNDLTSPINAGGSGSSADPTIIVNIRMICGYLTLIKWNGSGSGAPQHSISRAITEHWGFLQLPMSLPRAGAVSAGGAMT